MLGLSHLITQTLLALFAGGIFISILPRSKDKSASPVQVGFTLAILAYVSYLAIRGVIAFDLTRAGEIQFLERAAWLPSLGVFYAVGVDGISLTLWMLSVGIAVLVVGWTLLTSRPKVSLLVSMLLLVAAVIGCFVARDLVLFFTFFELMLLPSYLLMIGFGSQPESLPKDGDAIKYGALPVTRERATMMFVLYTALAGALLLGGIICTGALQATTGVASYAFEDLTAIASRAPWWIVVLFAIAFGIKAAIVPLHGWLVATYERAPIQATILFSALLSKVGVYGLIRICGGIFKDSFVDVQPIIFVLGAVGILYGALLAMAQPNVRRMLAYSSLSHLGFCFLGIGAGTLESYTGASLQMVNHGISIAALFMIVWALEQRSVDLRFSATQGLASRVPWITGYFLIFTLSSVALPLTNNFVGEFLILAGAVSKNPGLGAIAIVGVIFSAMYMLQTMKRLFHGELSTVKNGGLLDLAVSEKLILSVFVIAIFLMGIAPQPMLKAIQASVTNTAFNPDLFVELTDTESLSDTGPGSSAELGNTTSHSALVGAVTKLSGRAAVNVGTVELFKLRSYAPAFCAQKLKNSLGEKI